MSEETPGAPEEAAPESAAKAKEPAESEDSPETRAALAQIRMPPPRRRGRSMLPIMGVSLVLAVGAAYVVSRGGKKRPPPPNVVMVHGTRAASPEENESALAQPLEQAIATVPGIAHLESRSSAQGTTLVVSVAPGKDSAAVAMAVHEAAQKARPQLPQEVAPFDIAREDAPVAAGRFVIEGGNLDPAALLHFADRVVRRDLLTMPGVRSSNCGGAVQQLVATVDSPRMRALGLRWSDVTTAFAPAGALGAAPTDLGVLSKQVVRRADGEKPAVLLGDVARFTIEMAPADCLATRDGVAPVVVGTVAADSEEALARVAARLAQAERKSPPGVHLHLVDFAESVADAKARRARTLRGRIFGASDVAKVLRELRAALPLADVVAYEVDGDSMRFAARAPGEEERTPRELLAAAGRKLAPIVGCIAWESSDHVASVRVRIRGESSAELRRLGDLAASAARGAKGVVGAAVTTHRAAEPNVDVDRVKAATLGLPVSEVREQLLLQTEGAVVGRFGEADALLDLLVRGSEPSRTPDSLQRLWVSGPQGPVAAAQVATFRKIERETVVLREDQRRAIDVCVHGDGKLERAVASTLGELALPPGYVLDITPY